MRKTAFYLLLSVCAVSVLGDRYHPKFSDPDPDNEKRTEASSGTLPPLGEGLHKIPYADWDSIAKTTLNKRLTYEKKTNVPKNVVFIIGDGLDITTQTLARYHKSQTEGITIDKVHLAWDDWVDAGVVKTYNSDAGVPDSAGTATAFLSGKKTRTGVIGMDERVVYGTNCSLYDDTHKLKSSLRYAQEAGKLTGIVTTARITHATPASAFAHIPHRGWEWERGVSTRYRPYCTDISKQLIYDEWNQDIRVLLGGGRRHFFLDTEADLEYTSSVGYRRDINLVEEWKRIKKEAGYTDEQYKYVWNQTAFDAVDPEVTKYLFGMFERTHMQYEALRHQDTAGEPSLTEMVEKAIRILEKADNGFYLFVESGRIDHAHHGTRAQRASIETWMMSDAVQKVLDMTDPEETLVVVSSDHAHVMTMNGYTHLDTPLYGIVIDERRRVSLGQDDLPYQSVSYANGPGHSHHIDSDRRRVNLTDETPEEYNDVDRRHSAMVGLSSETHGAADVGMFATGPWAHLFTGSVEQHYLATAIMYATCINPELQGEHCAGVFSSAHNLEYKSLFMIVCLTALVFLRRMIA